MEQYFPVGCIKKAKQMANSLSLLPDLELQLFDDSEVKTDDIFQCSKHAKELNLP